MPCSPHTRIVLQVIMVQVVMVKDMRLSTPRSLVYHPHHVAAHRACSSSSLHLIRILLGRN